MDKIKTKDNQLMDFIDSIQGKSKDELLAMQMDIFKSYPKAPLCKTVDKNTEYVITFQFNVLKEAMRQMQAIKKAD